MSEHLSPVFSIKGFCSICGVYKRPGLARTSYRDSVGRNYRHALVCAACYDDISESEEYKPPVVSPWLEAYPEVNAVLLGLLARVRAVLGDAFVGMYLHGSLAVGDFDEDSDIDYVVVTEGAVAGAMLADLQAMHADLAGESSRWVQELEGLYIPRDVFRRYDPLTERYLYLDRGQKELVLVPHGIVGVIQRAVLRSVGVTVAGPTPDTLLDAISPDAIRLAARVLLQERTEALFATPDDLNNGWFQPYTVLALCRLLFTLQTGDPVVSKPVAARWAQEMFGAPWAGLIEHAVQARPNPPLKARSRAEAGTLAPTLDFARYAQVVGASL